MEDLLNREADPDGERYALAKVLHTCQVRVLNGVGKEGMVVVVLGQAVSCEAACGTGAKEAGGSPHRAPPAALQHSMAR